MDNEVSDRDDKLLLELADESRREFLKKLGKGLAMAGVTSTTGLKSGLAAAKKVVKLPSYVEKGDFDSYDALEYALDNMFEYGRAASELSMPLDLQQKIGNKLQHKIIGHKYYAVPGGPSSLRPTDYDFYSSLRDNAEEYGDMDEAIDSTSATLQDVFDYPKIFKGADKIWKEKGKAGLDDIEKYIKDNVEGYIEADKKGDTGYEGEPEPVDEDPRDYLERDYASGPHMNSFKPEMSFNDFYLTEMGGRGSGKPQMQLNLDLIKQGHAEGKSASEIARELRVSTPTITKKAEKMNPPLKFPFWSASRLANQRMPRGMDSPVYIDTDNEKIKQMYQDGLSSYEIGKQLGVSKTTITNRLKAMGLPIRPRGSAPFKKGSYLDEDVTDEEMPETVFGGPGEAEAANKGKKMRKGIPQQPNVAGAPEIINNPGPNYANQPSLGQVKNRTYKNKNLVSGLFKTNV